MQLSIHHTRLSRFGSRFAASADRSGIAHDASGGPLGLTARAGGKRRKRKLGSLGCGWLAAERRRFRFAKSAKPERWFGGARAGAEHRPYEFTEADHRKFHFHERHVPARHGTAEQAFHHFARFHAEFRYAERQRTGNHIAGGIEQTQNAAEFLGSHVPTGNGIAEPSRRRPGREFGHGFAQPFKQAKFGSTGKRTNLPLPARHGASGDARRCTPQRIDKRERPQRRRCAYKQHGVQRRLCADNQA